MAKAEKSPEGISAPEVALADLREALEGLVGAYPRSARRSTRNADGPRWSFPCVGHIAPPGSGTQPPFRSGQRSAAPLPPPERRAQAVLEHLCRAPDSRRGTTVSPE